MKILLYYKEYECGIPEAHQRDIILRFRRKYFPNAKYLKILDIDGDYVTIEIEGNFTFNDTLYQVLTNVKVLCRDGNMLSLALWDFEVSCT